MNELAILQALDAIRAAIEQLPAAIVAEIQAQLIIEPDAPAAAPAVTVCQHPVDQRVDLGDGDWECGVRTCRFQYSANPLGAPK